MIGGYADQAAHQAHLSTPHLLKYKTGTAERVRSLQTIETGPDHHSKRKIRLQADQLSLDGEGPSKPSGASTSWSAMPASRSWRRRRF
jgi:hypothetical protein